MKEKPGSVIRVAAPMRSLAQRFTFLLLLGTAVGLLMIGRTDPKIFEETRMALIDLTAPVLDALSQPVATISNAVDHVRELAHIRETNAALKIENARLLQWQHAARRLLAENDQLRTLLKYSGKAPTHSIAAPLSAAFWSMPVPAKVSNAVMPRLPAQGFWVVSQRQALNPLVFY